MPLQVHPLMNAVLTVQFHFQRSHSCRLRPSCGRVTLSQAQLFDSLAWRQPADRGDGERTSVQRETGADMLPFALRIFSQAEQF